MNDTPIELLAAKIEQMLPRIGRRIFTLPVNHPAGDLPTAQNRVCSFLTAFGESSISDIGDELGVSVSAATQIVDRLEKTGLIERRPWLPDRRIRMVGLTEHGLKVMEERRKRRALRVAEVLERMPPAEREKLVDSLATLLEACLGMPSESPEEGQCAGSIESESGISYAK
jgi:DNA-binding MarR family transcriptional regulator